MLKLKLTAISDICKPIVLLLNNIENIAIVIICLKMRLTNCVRAPIKRHWWGKGWGSKPWKDISVRLFKEQWKAKSKRPIFEHYQSFPADATIEDANEFVKLNFRREIGSEVAEEKQLPWPYSSRPVKGMSTTTIINILHIHELYSA